MIDPLTNRTMVTLVAVALLACGALAQPLAYDSDRRVPFLNGQGYERDEYHWWIKNTGQPSRLFQNGSFVSQETGTNDIELEAAWIIQQQGVPIGVFDIDNLHGQRVIDCARIVSRGDVLLESSNRLYADDIARGISNLVSAGLRVIVVTAGCGPNADVSNACRFAESKRALVVCAVPNSGVDIDVTPDYPSSWAGEITSIVPITATDRNGNLYGPNAAAWGTNVIGAPGRNIVAAGTYATGTSYAAPIAAGCLSLLVARYPNQTSSAYRQALKSSGMNAALLLMCPVPKVILRIQGLSEWAYSAEESTDLKSWNFYRGVVE